MPLVSPGSGLTGDHKSAASLYDAPQRPTGQADQTVAGHAMRIRVLGRRCIGCRGDQAAASRVCLTLQLQLQVLHHAVHDGTARWLLSGGMVPFVHVSPGDGWVIQRYAAPVCSLEQNPASYGAPRGKRECAGRVAPPCGIPISGKNCQKPKRPSRVIGDELSEPVGNDVRRTRRPGKRVSRRGRLLAAKSGLGIRQRWQDRQTTSDIGGGRRSLGVGRQAMWCFSLLVLLCGVGLQANGCFTPMSSRSCTSGEFRSAAWEEASRWFKGPLLRCDGPTGAIPMVEM